MPMFAAPSSRLAKNFKSADKPAAPQEAAAPDVAAITKALRQAFGVEFSLVDGENGQLLYAGEDQPVADWDARAELCRAVHNSRRAELIAEEGPLAALAIPLASAGACCPVAVATFVCCRSDELREVETAAALLGLTAADARAWMLRQPLWPDDALLRTGQLAREQWLAQQRAITLQSEVEDLSWHLSETYEEINLLHRLTGHLKISSKDDDLGRVALEWLAEVLPAQSLLLEYLPMAEDDGTPHDVRTRRILLTQGKSPVDEKGFSWLLERLGMEGRHRPVVLNPAANQEEGWPFPDIRQLILVPLADDENVFGWLAAFNHRNDEDFDTDAASLLASVAAILGVHSANTHFYREQNEVLASVVRALASAIDAKDPYTCGHSERVARVAVRLAQELGCDREQLRTIYFSGLLHDIGKIGVDDQVLRKPCRLNEAEFAHLKSHTEIGCKILQGMKRLDEVLPVVRHHHENWDGSGYPSRLAELEIPFLARVVAVADAFDAMSSDRPYRPALADDKLDCILKAGAGQQWDALVVAAFFRARGDIREIVDQQRENSQFDAPQWT